MKVLYIFFAFLIILFTSCKKEVLYPELSLFKINDTQHTLSLHAIDKDTLFAGLGKIFTTGGYVYKSIDAGETWTLTSNFNQAPISFFEKGSMVLSLCFGNEFYHRQKEEDFWTNIYLLGWEYWADVALNSQHRAIIVGGLNFASGCAQPIDIASGVANLHRHEFEHELKAVEFVNDNIAIAVGYGTILRSTNAGDTWQYLEPRGDFFQDIKFVNDTCGFVIGYNGTVLRTKDAGLTWKRVAKPSSLSNKKKYKKLFMASETLGWIAGEEGKLWQTNNGGEDWISIETRTNLEFNDIAYAYPYLFLATNEGYVLRVNL